jgi:hypothetical protein
MAAEARTSGAAQDWDRRAEEIERIYLEVIAAKRTRSRVRVVQPPPAASAGDAAHGLAEAEW